jgi:hypothetical protein
MPVRSARLLGFASSPAPSPPTPRRSGLTAPSASPPAVRLTIDADAADLRVTGTGGNQVVVHILLKASERALEHMTVTADQSGNDVAVVAKHGTGKWTDWFGSWSMDGKIEVQVPHEYNFDIHTSGGDITVGQLQGTAHGRTSGGDILVTDIHGPVDMQTFRR